MDFSNHREKYNEHECKKLLVNSTPVKNRIIFGSIFSCADKGANE